MSKKRWLVPLTGLVFIVLVIVGFIVAGEPPDADEDTQKIFDFYVDNKGSIEAGVFLLALGTVFFIFFANYLRILFRASATSATILVGAGLFAVGGGIDGTLLISMAEGADNDVPPETIQSLQVFWDNDFVPLAIGIAVFLVSIGSSILSTGLLPRWLGWVVLVVALISVTPLGFFAFPLTGLLVIVLSIWLTLRERSASAPPPPAPAVQ